VTPDDHQQKRKHEKARATGELATVIHALATAHFRKIASASAAAVFSHDPHAPDGLTSLVPLAEALHTGARALYPDLGANEGADHAQLVASSEAFTSESCLVDDIGEKPPHRGLLLHASVSSGSRTRSRRRKCFPLELLHHGPMSLRSAFTTLQALLAHEQLSLTCSRPPLKPANMAIMVIAKMGPTCGPCRAAIPSMP